MAVQRKKDEFNKEHPNLKGRIPPHSDEAETAVLASAMLDELAAAHILGALKTEDFYSPAKRYIFEAMQNIAAKSKPIDFVTLVSEVDALGQTEAVGGVSYLASLSNAVLSASNFAHYASIVKKNSLLRKLIKMSADITDKAFTGDPDDSALAYAESEVFAIAEKSGLQNLEHIRSPLSNVVKRLEYLKTHPGEDRGIPTGFKRLNSLLNGFQKSDLIVIGARPGQGKTSIGMNFLQHAVFDSNRRTKAGKPDPYRCAVFSIEMSADQIAKRLLCAVAKVNMTKVSGPQNLTEAEWKRIFAAKSKLDAAQLFIDQSVPTPAEILRKCRRLKREHGLDMVMVDHLQLMRSNRESESRQVEVASISRDLKLAAKELNVPILLLSQMRREYERDGKPPQMSDLKESGAIEQDADIVMFIHRKYAQNDPNATDEQKNTVKLIVAKHRNGELGEIDMRWRGEFTSFEDMDPNLQAPDASESSGNFSVSTDEDIAENEPSLSASAELKRVLSVADSDDEEDMFD